MWYTSHFPLNSDLTVFLTHLPLPSLFSSLLLCTGLTALFFAAQEGNPQMVRNLIMRRANPNVFFLKTTPLFIASQVAYLLHLHSLFVLFLWVCTNLERDSNCGLFVIVVGHPHGHEGKPPCYGPRTSSAQGRCQFTFQKDGCNVIDCCNPSGVA